MFIRGHLRTSQLIAIRRLRRGNVLTLHNKWFKEFVLERGKGSFYFYNVLHGRTGTTPTFFLRLYTSKFREGLRVYRLAMSHSLTSFRRTRRTFRNGQ